MRHCLLEEHVHPCNYWTIFSKSEDELLKSWSYHTSGFISHPPSTELWSSSLAKLWVRWTRGRSFLFVSRKIAVHIFQRNFKVYELVILVYLFLRHSTMFAQLQRASMFSFENFFIEDHNSSVTWLLKMRRFLQQRNKKFMVTPVLDVSRRNQYVPSTQDWRRGEASALVHNISVSLLNNSESA